ncbi:MAG: hypothetical protein KKE17_10280 [Proteobacteria bacterium]|nr:hypothetical protein [Pseudomonadota bacterium]MBU1710378.1 hypothetical protein [Pseudomonadota bacterium]
MKENDIQNKALDGLINELQVFVELSFQGDESSLREWISETINKIDGRCWVKKGCFEVNCPAYKNECGRCWLIAGTMCGGAVQGKFADKYGFCTECEIYQDNIDGDRIKRLRELIIALIHSLRLRQIELTEVVSELKVLRGILPICSFCKKIRDDQGYWEKVDKYISAHSDVLFSHGVCPECLQKEYPEFYRNKIEK